MNKACIRCTQVLGSFADKEWIKYLKANFPPQCPNCGGKAFVDIKESNTTIFVPKNK